MYSSETETESLSVNSPVNQLDIRPKTEARIRDDREDRDNQQGPVNIFIMGNYQLRDSLKGIKNLIKDERY